MTFLVFVIIRDHLEADSVPGGCSKYFAFAMLKFVITLHLGLVFLSVSRMSHTYHSLPFQAFTHSPIFFNYVYICVFGECP